MADQCSEYSHCIQIYTGGSKTETSAGIGVWSQQIKIRPKLPPILSIMSCELYAIMIALRFYQRYSEPLAIYTDSLSFLKAIDN